MFLTNHYDLERPYGPKRHERIEPVVFRNESGSRLPLQRQIVAKQAALMAGVVFRLGMTLFYRFVRQALVGPNLAVRVRIACAHHRPAVLKNLYPINEG